MIMFKKKQQVLLFVVYLFLMGCAASVPEKLGISDLEWESLGQDKQKTLLANYEWMLRERESKTEKREEK